MNFIGVESSKDSIDSLLRWSECIYGIRNSINFRRINSNQQFRRHGVLLWIGLANKVLRTGFFFRSDSGLHREVSRLIIALLSSSISLDSPLPLLLKPNPISTRKLQLFCASESWESGSSDGFSDWVLRVTKSWAFYWPGDRILDYSTRITCDSKFLSTHQRRQRALVSQMSYWVIQKWKQNILRFLKVWGAQEVHESDCREKHPQKRYRSVIGPLHRTALRLPGLAELWQSESGRRSRISVCRAKSRLLLFEINIRKYFLV